MFAQAENDGSRAPAYSADENGATYHEYACNVDFKPLLGPDGAFKPGVLEDGKSVVSDYNIKLDVNLAGNLDRDFLLNVSIIFRLPANIC